VSSIQKPKNRKQSRSEKEQSTKTIQAHKSRAKTSKAKVITNLQKSLAKARVLAEATEQTKTQARSQKAKALFSMGG
jgi:hypothetical protein